MPAHTLDNTFQVLERSRKDVPWVLLPHKDLTLLFALCPDTISDGLSSCCPVMPLPPLTKYWHPVQLPGHSFVCSAPGPISQTCPSPELLEPAALRNVLGDRAYCSVLVSPFCSLPVPSGEPMMTEVSPSSLVCLQHRKSRLECGSCVLSMLSKGCFLHTLCLICM